MIADTREWPDVRLITVNTRDFKGDAEAEDNAGLSLALSWHVGQGLTWANVNPMLPLQHR